MKTNLNKLTELFTLYKLLLKWNKKHIRYADYKIIELLELEIAEILEAK